MSFFENKVVLVTGGTGSFGKQFVSVLLREHRPRKLIIFSRDELKQHEMAQMYPLTAHCYYKYYVFVRPERLRAGWDRDRSLGPLPLRANP